MESGKVREWMQMAGLSAPDEAAQSSHGKGKGSTSASQPSGPMSASMRAALQIQQVSTIQQATTGQPMSWHQLQLMQGRLCVRDAPGESTLKSLVAQTSQSSSAGAPDAPSEAPDGAAAAAREGAASKAAAAEAASYGSSAATDLTTVDEGQLEEYQRMVAALQLQYAAMGALGAEAGGTEGGRDAAGPLGLLGAPGPGASAGIKTAGAILSHDPHRRYTGSVFKWDDDAGWGFISCIEARKVYGKDVFLHKAEIGGISDLYKQRTKIEIKNGDWVAFQVEISRGKPRARDVEKIDTPEEYTKGAAAAAAAGKLESENSSSHWSNSYKATSQFHTPDRENWWGKRKRADPNF